MAAAPAPRRWGAVPGLRSVLNKPPLAALEVLRPWQQPQRPGAGVAVQEHAVQCNMPNSTAYQYACSMKRRPRAAQSCPYTGRRGMQCSMPNSTAYQYACSTKRRPARRAKPPLHGAQGHAVRPAQQHGVPVRVLYKAAPRAPRKAAPTRGARACNSSFRNYYQRTPTALLPVRCGVHSPRKLRPTIL